MHNIKVERNWGNEEDNYVTYISKQRIIHMYMSLLDKEFYMKRLMDTIEGKIITIGWVVQNA